MLRTALLRQPSFTILTTTISFADLTHDGVIFKTADVLSLQQSIFANPGAFGFTSISNVDGPNGPALINPDPTDIPNSWALYGTIALLRSPDAAQTSFLG